MKKASTYRLLFVILTLLCGASAARAEVGNKDIELLRRRVTVELLHVDVSNERVTNLLESCRTDGSWPGINYEDTTRTGFQHTRHLNNLLELSRAYRKRDSDFRNDPQVKKTLMRALDFWLDHDFICENWWHNQVGTPNAMAALLLIVDKDLTPQRAGKMLEIAGRGTINAWGARPSGDRIKIAGIQAKVALYLRDEPQFKMLMQVIEGEIHFSQPSTVGLQYDYSFHHRADRVNNTLSYGLGYAEAFAEWAALVADTHYRFGKQSVEMLVDYYLNGICTQMVYGRSEDTGIKNRDITRRQGSGVASTTVPRRLLRATDYRKEELETVIKLRQGEPATIPSFARFFWQSEHFVYQRPGFYTSVRMYSVRNANMEEPYNGEGLMNHYRGDGANYISVRGDEYTNLAPIYDWMRIPGATTMLSDTIPPETEIQKKGLTEFVGAVTDGRYGAVAFNFRSPHNPLSARKSWFFFDNEYVCLGNQITSATNRQVVTTLDQSHLNGAVTLKDQNGKRTIEKGERPLKDLEWIHHDQVGYLFLTPDSAYLQNDVAIGNWNRVNRQTGSSREEVRADVFKLWLPHGANLRDATYEYIIMPGATVEEVETYAGNPILEILSNTADLQAVHHKGLRITHAIFYKAGELTLPDNRTVALDSPGMLLIKQTEEGKISEITVSDPTRKLSKIHLSSDYPTLRHLTIDLPQTVFAGKSVTVRL